MYVYDIEVQIEVYVTMLMDFSVRWSNGQLRPVPAPGAPSRGRELHSGRLPRHRKQQRVRIHQVSHSLLV